MNRVLLIVLTGAVLLGWIGSSHGQRRDEAGAATAQRFSKHVAEGHRHHRHHQLAFVLVFVPALGAPGDVPYYYATYYPYPALAYVEQDPPSDAYQEPNGFFYYCVDPPGYYPAQQDCPNGWSLVAP